MLKKAFFCSFIASILTLTSCRAQEQNDSIPFQQTAGTEFVEGMIRIKLVDKYPLDFTVDSTKSIAPSTFPFLKRAVKKYGITNVQQEFTLNNDASLLHILTVFLEKKEKTDQLIEKLQKNKNIEYAEKVRIKRLSKIKTM